MRLFRRRNRSGLTGFAVTREQLEADPNVKVLDPGLVGAVALTRKQIMDKADLTEEEIDDAVEAFTADGFLRVIRHDDGLDVYVLLIPPELQEAAGMPESTA